MSPPPGNPHPPSVSLPTMRGIAWIVLLGVATPVAAAPTAPPPPTASASAPGSKPAPTTSAAPTKGCAPPSTTVPIRAEIDKHYQAPTDGGPLSLFFAGCAAVQGPIASLTVELGHGHSFGRTLTVARLVRKGAAWEVTALELDRGKGKVAAWGGETTDGVRLRTFTVSDALGGALVDFAGTALSVTLSEPKKGNGLGMSGWASSSDFYAAVTLVGTNTVDRHYAGYKGSGDQLTYLPVLVTADVVLTQLALAKQATAPLDAGARALFSDRVLLRRDHLEGSFHWWVREAYARAAPEGGDKRLLPLLQQWLALPSGASEDRTRVAAVNALAGITGDDRRFDAAGAPRPTMKVVKDYLTKPAKAP